jgi:hypothetical protein
VAFVTRRDLWREHARWNLEQAFEGKEPGTNEKRNRLMKAYYGKLMPFVYLRDPFGIFSLTRIVGTFAAGLFRPVIRFGGHGDQRVILHKSCALAAQTFMLSVTAEGYDTCPMEGFDRVRVSRLLGLRGDAEICMIVAVGKGTPAGVYVSSVTPPSISISVETPAAAIRFLNARIFCRASGMNFCPPKPGLTLITQTRSISSSRSKTDSTGV